MKTDEIDNDFQMVTSSDGDINERANEVIFLFSYQCRSENSAPTKFQLDFIPTSTSIQPHFNSTSTQYGYDIKATQSCFCLIFLYQISSYVGVVITVDIKERANKVIFFLFSYQCRSEKFSSAPTKFQLDLIPTSTPIQPHFNLKFKLTSASISTQPQLNIAVS